MRNVPSERSSRRVWGQRPGQVDAWGWCQSSFLRFSALENAPRTIRLAKSLPSVQLRGGGPRVESDCTEGFLAIRLPEPAERGIVGLLRATMVYRSFLVQESLLKSKK